MCVGGVGVGVNIEGAKKTHLYFTPNIEAVLDFVMMRMFSDMAWVKNCNKIRKKGGVYQTGLFHGLNKLLDMNMCLALTRCKSSYCLLSPDGVPSVIGCIILLS